MKRICLTLALAIVVSNHSVIAFAVPIYTVTDLGDLTTGTESSIAYGINSLGQAVGYANDTSGPLSTQGPHAFLWTPTTPNGTTGSMVGLGSLPGFTGFNVAYGINSAGQVTGQNDRGLDGHAFLWSPASPNGTTGTMTDIIPDVPGAPISSTGVSINSVGQVVGESISSTADHAYLWSPTVANGSTGSNVDLGTLLPNERYSYARGINDLGQVTGQSTVGNFRRAFLWTPTANNATTGSMVNLGDLPGGDDFSTGAAINSLGQVVGTSTGTGNVTHAILWNPNTPNGTTGTMFDLGNIPSSQPNDRSDAYGINSQGQIVGGGHGAAGPRAFIWFPSSPNGTTGALFQLDTLLAPASAGKWTLDVAYGINDAGQIVGAGTFDPDGPGGVAAISHAFLLTPGAVPEPSTVALIALGALLAGVFYRRAAKSSVT